MDTKKRIIFIHVPKCGGNSIKDAFMKACKNRPDIDFISIGHMDINYYIDDYRKYLLANGKTENDPETTIDYFKDTNTLFFTVTRNPYRRFISAYFYKLNSDDFFKSKLEAVKDINEFADNLRNNYNIVFWRQSWFLERSDQVHDFKFFQLEKLGKLVEFFKEKFDLDLDIGKTNVTEESGNSGLDILNRNSIQTINTWFQSDFRAYEYYMINPRNVPE
jgi:hypothetical protein